MSKSSGWPRNRIDADARTARTRLVCGARVEWLPWLDRLLNAKLVHSETHFSPPEADRWTPEARVFAQVFAKKARAARETKGMKGKRFSPRVWTSTGSKFVEADATDVHRWENPENFSPLDLCENCFLLGEHDGNELVGECNRTVQKLFGPPYPPVPGAAWSFSVGDVMAAIATALRAAAETGYERWSKSWGQPEGSDSEMGEFGIRLEEQLQKDITKELPREIRKSLCFVKRSVRALPGRAGVVLVVEGLGGMRNLRSRLPFYTSSVAAAWVTVEGKGLRFVPICAGVCVPSMRHLFLGVNCEGGGAVLIDERPSIDARLFEVYRLGGSNAPAGGSLTVGIHHSRSRKQKGWAFVNRVSRLLPAYVDKEIALGAGAWSLSLTAAGSLAAYFEPSIDCCSAYAGATILAAATGLKESATDLNGNPWTEGNPLRKTGILAWSHEGLRAKIGHLIQVSGEKRP